MRKKSHSEWDISGSEGSLVGHLAPLKPMDQQDQVKSQYFDALEVIDETDDDDLESTSSWEDVSSTGSGSPAQEDTGVARKSRNKTREDSRPISNRSDTSSVVRKRIKGLKRLQLEHSAIESGFYLELHDISARFRTDQQSPLEAERNRVLAQTSGPGSDPFWLKAMKQCRTLCEIVHPQDEPILSLLEDIRIKLQPLKVSR